MRVKITCTPNNSRPEIVYADVTCADELIISATLNYCLTACADRGYTIENAQEVLMWLYGNAEFRAN
jgi:hypothetical protein